MCYVTYVTYVTGKNWNYKPGTIQSAVLNNIIGVSLLKPVHTDCNSVVVSVAQSRNPVIEQQSKVFFINLQRNKLSAYEMRTFIQF